MRGNSEISFSVTAFNRVSEWDEYLMLTRRRKSTFTIGMRSAGDGNIESAHCSRPFRSARDFVLALDQATSDRVATPRRHPVATRWREAARRGHMLPDSATFCHRAT